MFQASLLSRLKRGSSDSHRYSAYGLTWQLPFHCDALNEADPNAVTDIEVAEGAVPTGLLEPLFSDPNYDVTTDRLLFRGGPRSGRFLVESGTKITCLRHDECENGIFTYHLLHQAFASLLRQRGLLVLHASAAARNGIAVGLTGQSGAGKTSTTAALVAGGWQLIGDEILALRLDTRGTIEVLPGAFRIHLPQETAANLPFETSGLIPREWHRGKLAMPLPQTDAPAVMTRLVHLKTSTEPEIRIEPVTGFQKMPFLLQCLYGPSIAPQIATGFGVSAAVLDTVQFLSLYRPADRWSLDAVAAAVSGDQARAA
ncbi:MAG TPA: hypothetical protein VH206_05230 [Xanthobacteraceae bacterium]|jgi:hypothetical protein|nr:hypothetical protein [Xanthobacteraceae bacterium]